MFTRFTIILFSLLSYYRIAAQNDTASRPYPPTGKLVDIGGWRLHLNCSGQQRDSQPAVILEAGLGDFSAEWSLVQPGVAKFTKVCSYDRAGDGWSDWGPYPRTMRQIVYELHSLLQKSLIKPPFILVAHSYGGWLMRLYAYTYPKEVVGMVLLDAGTDDPRRLSADGKSIRSSDMLTGQTIPPVKTNNPMQVKDIPAVAMQQIKAGLPLAVQHANDPPRNKLPAEAQRMRTWALAQTGHVVATINPFEPEELLNLRKRKEETKYPLGNMPLIVIVRGLQENKGPDAKKVEEQHRKDEEAIAALSQKGKLVIAERSSHQIQLDEPELVIQSILDVMKAINKR